ncbi:amidophosphoribosyltransferase [Tissierella sp. Yu-01]|uniref:amidophosphoribosyltransferase n=1 Tax=Tissierella sp. Yu-01 TaxID=3035694 RepID=UPI00240E75A9|nr:amidophosphoribosyltransferase [Tissierella sp. Yu-01]WFA08811.1 amidophosphoribosyltransferase [Tissierella sp. Yu-01]
MSGVVGIYSAKSNDVSQLIYYGLYALQHRGQVSCGIAVNNNGYIDYYKELGLVHEIFSKDKLERLRGNIGIGHVRYASSNEEQNLINTLPLVAGYKRGALALTLDGTVVNSQSIKDGLEDAGIIFQSSLDGEVVANLIARNHKDNLEEAIIKTLNEIEGSYGLIMMTSDRLIGARDPFGLKPLSIGKLDNDYLLASESCAFDTIGAEFVRDVEPGEIVVINHEGIRTINKNPKKRSLCLFELIYFARPDSLLDGKSIYLSRLEAGRQLARESENYADIVIGAPDSGIVFAIGYAEESKIPYAEGIIKNRYVGRTFIQPSQDLREQGVKIKLNVVKENIKGKRVILVDDSIVRGTTIKRTVDMLKKAGAKEVHVRIASPQVINPCHLGMDTPSKENLIAAKLSTEEIRELIGADSLNYLSIDGLVQSVGGNNGFCKGCFNGEYAIKPFVKKQL